MGKPCNLLLPKAKACNCSAGVMAVVSDLRGRRSGVYLSQFLCGYKLFQNMANYRHKCSSINLI